MNLKNNSDKAKIIPLMNLKVPCQIGNACEFAKTSDLLAKLAFERILKVIEESLKFFVDLFD